jgi:drug/metabolite transporter (DMT)-like permease
MRLLADHQIDLDWILFYKELIGFSILFPWIFFRYFQGRFKRISRRLIIHIVIAAAVCEIFGAHLQVLGYALIGLIVTVPLIQSSTLIGVAILGRYFLGDILSHRRRLAIGILIIAVVLISIGKVLTEQNGNNTQYAGIQGGSFVFILIALGAIGAGIAYSIYVVMLRYTMRKYWNDDNGVRQSFQFTKWAGFDLPQQDINVNQNINVNNNQPHGVYAPFPVTLGMTIILGVGVLVFGACILAKGGGVGFFNAVDFAWYVIPISGLSNVIGFFCQVQGLRMTSAVQASLISVSQMIFLSVIGFFCFRESINFVVMLGLTLTAYGVIISAKPEINPSQN